MQSGAIRCNQVQSGRRKVRMLIHTRYEEYTTVVISGHQCSSVLIHTRYEEYTTVGDFVKSGCVAMP